MSAPAFKKILVYVTTRNENHAALDRAIKLAKHSGASLTVLAVAEELPLLLRRSVRGIDELKKSLLAETDAHLRALSERWSRQGLSATTEVRYGRPYLEIIRLVRKRKFDVVFKTAQAGALTPVFGTTGMRLLRKCPSAVWLEKPSGRRRLRRIIAAVDPLCEDAAGQQLNRKIVELGLTLAECEGAELTVLHAWHAFGEGILAGRAGISKKEVVKYHNAARRKAAEECKAFLGSFGGRVDKKQMRLLEGDPGRVIPRFTKDNRVDLLVMGSVARAGIAGLLIGNTAEQILSRVNCSILAVKPDGFVSPIKAR